MFVNMSMTLVDSRDLILGGAVDKRFSDKHEIRESVYC